MKFNREHILQRHLILLAFALISIRPVRAQDAAPQTPDTQQMQQRLEQLENEIQELRREIKAAAAQPKPSTPEPNAITSTAPAQAASAPEPEKEKQQKTGENTVDFYGFVMLDSGYNFGTIDPNWFDVVRPTKLNSFPKQFGPDGNTFWGVRQTRFGVKSFTPTPVGDLKTQFEFELFGTGVDAGQTTFRLRHAYGELGHFGAGQTWSPFMDIDVFPNSIEYWGPSGMVFFRNVQVRWMPIQGDSNVVIALERPGASSDQGIYANRIELQGVVPQFKWPDLSGHGRLARKWGYIQVGAIVRKIAWVDTNHDQFNLSGTAIGWGVNTSSNLTLSKKDVARLSVVYGTGIQNYMNDAPFDIGIKNNFSNPTSPIKGVPLPLLGIVSFLDHNWSSKYSTSAGYSYLNIENSNGESASDFHQGHYALANLLYHPVKKVTMGGEFQFGRRVNYNDGFNVNDYRMQFSFRYDWSKGFSF